MKKILALILCTILVVTALSVTAFADGEIVADTEQTMPVEDTLPIEAETALESEIPSENTVPTTSAEKIVEYIKTYFEEISVIVSLALYAFYQARKHIVLNKSIGILNNNAVEVSKNSDKTIQTALMDMKGMVDVVSDYKNELASLLAEVRATADEKKKLAVVLENTTAYLKAAELANEELSNELAELLVLANIPNAKKEELYSRHLAAVKEMHEAVNTEVIPNDHGTEE